MELYLNAVPYGGSNYGIESASRNFFGKNASDLSLAEAAYLASLTKAPTYYSPYGNHQEELAKRKDLALSKMAGLGFITPEELATAQKEKVVFINKGQNSIKAAHFSVYIRSYLEEKYGKDVVEQGGLKVITTINYSLQQKAEELAAKYAKENKEKFNASNNSIVAIDPKTGQILVMVGSKDYFNQEDQGNFNVALAHRQPGSSIKPFVYATAFKKAIRQTPSSLMFKRNLIPLAWINMRPTRPPLVHPAVRTKRQLLYAGKLRPQLSRAGNAPRRLGPIPQCPVGENALLGRHPRFS